MKKRIKTKTKKTKTKTKTWVVGRPRVLGWGVGKIGLSYGLNFDGFIGLYEI